MAIRGNYEIRKNLVVVIPGLLKSYNQTVQCWACNIIKPKANRQKDRKMKNALSGSPKRVHSAHPATSIFGRPGTIYEIDRWFLLFVNSKF